jgi:aminoacylase
MLLLMRVCLRLVAMRLQALEFREEQEKLLDVHAGCKHGDMVKRTLGDVTTINITALNAGVSNDGGKINTFALNVVPTEAFAGFDIRIAPHVDLVEFEAKLNEWCAEEGVSWAFAAGTNPFHEHSLTVLDDKVVWWTLFQEACSSIGVKLETEVFPAATDSRFLRRMGVPAVGFSPMRNTTILLHEHNENVPKHVFLEGIDVYETIFRKMFAHVEIVTP